MHYRFLIPLTLIVLAAAIPFSLGRDALRENRAMFQHHANAVERLDAVTTAARTFDEYLYWLTEMTSSRSEASEQNARLARDQLLEQLKKVETATPTQAKTIADSLETIREPYLNALNALFDDNRELALQFMMRGRQQAEKTLQLLFELETTARHEVQQTQTKTLQLARQSTRSGDRWFVLAGTTLILTTLWFIVAFLRKFHRLRTQIRQLSHAPDTAPSIIGKHGVWRQLSEEIFALHERFKQRTSTQISPIAEPVVTHAATPALVENQLVNTSASPVKELTSRVSESTSQLSSLASLLAEVAHHCREKVQTLSANSKHSSQNVQTVAAAAEEMSASIREVTTQIARSAEITKGATEQARNANSTVHNLKNASKKIGSILEVINTIAGEINLLALNATIEAARAGDAGKGFAVVAGEVKNLANQTAKATEEIVGLISSMQKETDNTTEAIEHISNTIGKMNTIASAISASIIQQQASMESIAHSASLAFSSTQELSDGVEVVAQAAEKSDSTSLGLLRAASTLSEHTASLQDELDQLLAPHQKNAA
ncbi:MAG: hypothetical protein KDD76_05075 [Rickettsiales bacterium]|nr:hypothetical protein [Rickettsiales bacterium]